MDYDQKKEKLRKYIMAVGKLERKCKAASVWEGMAEGRGGSVLSAGKNKAGADTIKETAIALRQECEELATEVNELRRQMVSSLSLIQNDSYREILECYYIEGVSTADLCQKTGYCKRHVQRLHRQAVNELAGCSSFFLNE